MSDSIYAACHAEGGMTAHYRNRDPRRLAFVAARYKWVAKMLEGKKAVLEIGCADGYFSPIVAQSVGNLLAIDSDAQSISEARAASAGVQFPLVFSCRDALSRPLAWYAEFDAIYALDVLEHIPAGEPERDFLSLVSACNGGSGGVVILGMPSIESQPHASELSRAGHVNCKSGRDLRRTLEAYFPHVFVFSMSDEVVHTGFQPMAQYLLALCVA